MTRASRSATIAPSKISTLDDWVKARAKKYANLQVRESDGALLVLDPETLDSTSPVKTILRTKAIDAVEYLINGKDKELRAQAQTRMESLSKERFAKSTAAADEFREKQRILLSKHTEWVHSESEVDRIRLATEIGELQKELALHDGESRRALFPKRYILEKELRRVLLDDDSGQKREAARNIFCIINATTDAKDREVSVA